MKKFIKIIIIFLLPLAFIIGTKIPKIQTVKNSKSQAPTPTPSENISSYVIPDKGIALSVSLKDLVIKMIATGAIDKNKFNTIYQERGGIPKEYASVLDKPNNEPIIINLNNANLFLNLLWPLGIANKTKILDENPMGTTYQKEVANFASTGGWTLGKIDGGKLYNSQNLLSLTSAEEKRVAEISKNIYRPCCGNSTYFPDCNHGAAMLGFIELAVSQGINDKQIYKEALALNSFWFPQTYVEIATYFKSFKNEVWEDANPQEILGSEFSSIQGAKKVTLALQEKNLIPNIAKSGGCGV